MKALDWTDWLLIVGIALVTMGAGMVYRPAGVITLGVICLVLWQRIYGRRG